MADRYIKRCSISPISGKYKPKPQYHLTPIRMVIILKKTKDKF